jgi:tyrosine-specific transport protein
VLLKKDKMMNDKTPTLQIISIGFLIVGNLIGAGILALPINTGLAGFFPSVAGLILTSAAMYYSSVILSREAIERKESTFNYPSLYRHYLGHTGEWIAILANLIILYGLLTAYLTGITSIVGNLFHLSISPVWIMLGFFAVVTVISMAGIAGIQKYIVMLILFAVFFLLEMAQETGMLRIDFDAEYWK